MRNFLIFFITTTILLSSGGSIWAENDPGYKGAGKDSEELNSLFDREKKLMLKAASKPNDPLIMKRMADLRAAIAERLSRKNDFEHAIDYLHNSVQLDPTHADRWELLGDLSNFIGHPSSKFIVEYAYKRALSIDPNRSSARLKLAGSYVSADRFIRAMEQLEILIEETKNERDWKEIGLLASVYVAEDQIPKGRSFFRKIIDKGGDNRYRLALAILTNAAGENNEAVALLKEIEKSEEKDSQLRLSAANLRKKYSGERNGQ